MSVIPVPDLSKEQAVSALQKFRTRYYPGDPSSQTEILEKVYQKVGGRLSFLNRVAKSSDMLKTCEEICRTEKTWFLNQCWILGEEMDDDVMDSQKYCVSIRYGFSFRSSEGFQSLIVRLHCKKEKRNSRTQLICPSNKLIPFLVCCHGPGKSTC